MADDVTPAVGLLVAIGDMGTHLGKGQAVDVKYMQSLHMQLTSILPTNVLVSRLVSETLDKRPHWKAEFILRMLLLTLENRNQVECFSFLQFSHFDGSGNVERAVAEIISKSWPTMQSGFIFDFQKCGDGVTPSTFTCIWDAVLHSTRHVVCKVPAPIYDILIQQRSGSERIVRQRAPPILGTAARVSSSTQLQPQRSLAIIERPKILLRKPTSASPVSACLAPASSDVVVSSSSSLQQQQGPQNNATIDSAHPPHQRRGPTSNNSNNMLAALYSQNVAAAKALFEEYQVPIEDLFHNSKRHIITRYIDRLILDPKKRALGHDIERAAKLLRGDDSIETAVKSGRISQHTGTSKRPREEDDQGPQGMNEGAGEDAPIGLGIGGDQNRRLPANAGCDERTMAQWAAGMWSGYVVEEMSQWREGDLLVETIGRHGEGTSNQQAMLCAAKYLLHLRRTKSSSSSSVDAEREEGEGSGRDREASLLFDEVRRFMNI